MPEFSIIIPIYNVEKYIRECVDSVLMQSFQNFELILVDDGSSDNCALICDNYKKTNFQVKVIHKKNGGLSSARNAGIEIANGNYVIFLDGDDFWDDKMALEHIHNNLNESRADVLIFPAKRYYETEKKYTYILKGDVERKKIMDCDVDVAIRYMLEKNIYRAAAWNKVIKKSIIDHYSMRFKEGYLSEDMDWCGDLLLYSSKFDFYENPLYAYRQQRNGSITSGKTEKLVGDKLYMCEKGYKQSEMLLDQNKCELLASYYAYEYSVLLGVSSGIKNRKLLYRMEKLQSILNYDICNKVKIVNGLRKKIGYSLTRKVLCFFVKIKR